MADPLVPSRHGWANVDGFPTGSAPGTTAVLGRPVTGLSRNPDRLLPTRSLRPTSYPSELWPWCRSAAFDGDCGAAQSRQGIRKQSCVIACHDDADQTVRCAKHSTAGPPNRDSVTLACCALAGYHSCSTVPLAAGGAASADGTAPFVSASDTPRIPTRVRSRQPGQHLKYHLGRPSCATPEGLPTKMQGRCPLDRRSPPRWNGLGPGPPGARPPRLQCAPADP